MLSLNTLIWLLLVAFICNDGEELLTAGPWVRKNRGKYRFAPEALMLDLNKPLTPQFAVAIAVVGSVVLTATLLGVKTFAATGQLHGLFVSVLVLVLLDGVKHILLTLGIRQYSSGVVSAVLVEVPYGAYALYRFLEAGLLTWGEILLYGAFGVALVFPVLWLGFALGRWIVPARKERIAS